MRKIFAITLLLFFQITSSFAQADIAEARTYAEGLGVTVTGIVTNDDELGPIRYIQDATGGIPFYDPDIADLLNPGDEVTVTGEIGFFNGLKQVVNVVSHTINSTGNALPATQLITPNQLNDDTEAEIVSINNVVFTDGGGGSQFTGNTTFGFSANGEIAVTYVRTGSPLVGFTIPETPVNLTGIVSQFNGIYQILARGEADIDGNFVDKIEQTNITKNSFDISWESNFAGSSNLKYGTDPTNLSQEINNAGSTLAHSASLTGLDPATFYYVQVSTENGADAAQSAVRVFSTESNSTGEMKIYFNRAVDNSFSTGVDAIYKPGAQIIGEIVGHIDNAQTSVDMCVYNINNLSIVVALNAAITRGVIVRYIANSGTLNSALDGSIVPVEFPNLKLNGSALMHNKFMIVDQDSEDNSWVMSGSMNLTSNNISDDFNNILFIQDQSLAKAYTLEFNEMWGGDGPSPSVFTVKVGDQKEDNTPHNFIIGGDLVESYFSPSDNTTNAISGSLLTADNDIQFAVLSFTMNDMRDALIDRDNNGVAVRGLIESINDLGGDYDALVAAGVNVKAHPETYDIHHKYAIVDANDPSSDPQVVTGSHNWSAGAESSNDENTLIIHSPIVANIFLQEFEARWDGLLESVKGVKSIPGFEVLILPNPVQDIATIQMDSERTNDVVLTLWTMDGQQLQSRILRKMNGKELVEINVNNYPSGNYLLTFQIGNAITAKQMVIQK
jgi:phosphatidylserine/phosphatidylglycerophosphate/cardiolipin synthase-like enzyme